MEKSVPKRWTRKKNYACLAYSSNSWRSLPRSIEPDALKRLLKKRFTPKILLTCGYAVYSYLNCF
jgi:hypothetical protein